MILRPLTAFLRGTMPGFIGRPQLGAALAWVATVALHAGTAPAVTPAPAAITVRIEVEKNHGVWEGWGCSLAWMGKVFGDRTDIADLFFTDKTVTVAGSDLPGLHFNIVRYNAGASSWNTLPGGRKMVASTTILPFRQIEGFWLDPRNRDPASDAWNWSVDVNQRTLLQNARDRGATRFELFSNSPMWWMTKNDNPSGAADGGNNIDPARYADFAHYLASIARHAKDHWGISFTTVSPFNEPAADWWTENNKQESTHVTPAEQMKILPLVRTAFDAQGLKDVNLSASDESYYDQAVKTWEAFTPATKALVDQVNVHGYQGAKGRRAHLHEITRVAHGKRLWNSEHGDKDGSGLELAANLHLDFFHLHPTAWAYWQPIDGGRTGEGGSGWGLLDARLLDGTRLKMNPKYYVLAHYSRHIRPGMTIHLGADPRTVFAVNRAAKKAVIVSFNSSDTATAYTYDLASLGRHVTVTGTWLTQPATKLFYQTNTRPVRTEGAVLTLSAPAHSIQTIEFDYR